MHTLIFMKKLHQKDELKMYCQRWHNRFGERSCRRVEFRIKGGDNTSKRQFPAEGRKGDGSFEVCGEGGINNSSWEHL